MPGRGRPGSADDLPGPARPEWLFAAAAKPREARDLVAGSVSGEQHNAPACSGYRTCASPQTRRTPKMTGEHLTMLPPEFNSQTEVNRSNVSSDLIFT